MASERRTCKTCHEKFSRTLGSRRVHCESCRPPRVRSAAADVAAVVELPADGAKLGPLESQALADLEGAGRAKTTAGAAALYVARQLDAGGHSGSQTSALVARLLEAVEKATAGAKPKADALDELRERRHRRAAGA